jgi:hypothetical protein
MQPEVIERTLAAIKVGQATQFRNLIIFPLFATEARQPDYLTLDEALGGDLARITEVSEAGAVPELFFENLSDRKILLLDGEELVGAKQNRVLNVSILVPPQARIPIPVSCVEQGRWAWKSRHFGSMGRAMYARARAKKMASVSASMRDYGSRRSDQGEVWADIEMKISAREADAPSRSMEDVFEHERAALDEYEKAFVPHERQAGAVFAISGRIQGMELFGASGAFAKYLGKLVRSYAMDAVEEEPDRVEQPSETAPKRFIEDLLKANASAYKAVGEGEDVRVEGEGFSGGALVSGEHLVHLAAFRPSGPTDDVSKH